MVELQVASMQTVMNVRQFINIFATLPHTATTLSQIKNELLLMNFKYLSCICIKFNQKSLIEWMLMLKQTENT